MTSVEKDTKILLGILVISTINTFDQKLKSRTTLYTYNHLKCHLRKLVLLSLRQTRIIEYLQSLIHFVQIGSSVNSYQRSLINHKKYLRHIPSRTQRIIKLQRNIILLVTRYIYFYVDALNKLQIQPNLQEIKGENIVPTLVILY